MIVQRKGSGLKEKVLSRLGRHIRGIKWKTGRFAQAAKLDRKDLQRIMQPTPGRCTGANAEKLPQLNKEKNQDCFSSGRK